MNARSTITRLLGVLALIAAAAVALGQAPATAPPAPPPQPATRFEAVDLYIDSAAVSLAAYQVDLRAVGGQVSIVGIEGGDPAPFKQPPYYDPAAIQHEHVILAALSTAAAKDLPTGRVRVARVHIQITGNANPDWTCTLITAGSADGAKIPAIAQIKRQGEDK